MAALNSSKSPPMPSAKMVSASVQRQQHELAGDVDGAAWCKIAPPIGQASDGLKHGIGKTGNGAASE
jgi:hypothetical protein